MNNITPTLSRYDFIETMDYIHECFRAGCDIEELSRKYPNAMEDVSLPIYAHNITIIINLLENIFHCKTDEDGVSTITYWVYETSCGEHFTVGNLVNNFLPSDHQYFRPDLRTANDLYDYLVWEMNNE